MARVQNDSAKEKGVHDGSGFIVVESSQQVGVRVLIAGPRIQCDLPNETGWQEVVQAVVDDYANHAALWGYLLTDEPHLRHFENLARL